MDLATPRTLQKLKLSRKSRNLECINFYFGEHFITPEKQPIWNSISFISSWEITNKMQIASGHYIIVETSENHVLRKYQ